MRIGRRLSIGLLGLVSATACAPTAIQDGIWKWSVQAEDVRSGLAVPVPDTKVQVTSEWGGDDSQTVEIVPIATSRPEGWVKVQRLDPIYAVVPPGKSDLEVRMAQDSNWTFNMLGRILDENTVDGVMFFARHREEPDRALQGRWSLTWMGPLE